MAVELSWLGHKMQEECTEQIVWWEKFGWGIVLREMSRRIVWRMSEEECQDLMKN